MDGGCGRPILRETPSQLQLQFKVLYIGYFALQNLQS